MYIPEIIKITARDLRQNMTKSEIELWASVKGKKLGIRFLRQKPIYVYTENNGLDRFIIADFYCRNSKLIIELDGSIHNIPEICELDKHKELLLSQLGIKVIRFSNSEVFDNIDVVLNKIKNSI